jgi:hypothetical protein
VARSTEELRPHTTCYNIPAARFWLPAPRHSFPGLRSGGG